MKSGLLFLAVFFLMALQPNAQQMDSWTIRLNSKTILTASKENEKANKKKLTAAEWKKSGILTIRYKAVDADKGWRRSLAIYDEDDNELIRKDGVARLDISIAKLKKTFVGKKMIRIFTMLSPLDPDLAARARLRRVHLCTLEL